MVDVSSIAGSILAAIGRFVVYDLPFMLIMLIGAILFLILFIYAMLKLDIWLKPTLDKIEEAFNKHERKINTFMFILAVVMGGVLGYLLGGFYSAVGAAFIVFVILIISWFVLPNKETYT